MSSAAILAQINALQAKVDALNEAIGHLNNASASFGQFPPVLEEIGAGWKNSIIINGEPADKGKAVERAKEFQGFISKISSIIGVIAAKIAEYEAKIAALWIEYWAAKKAEEEAARAAAYAGTQINGHRAGDSSAVACFKKNTKVLTNKGYINIQDIKVNDLVVSYNIDSNKNGQLDTSIDAQCTNLSIKSDSELTCTAPQLSPGTYNLFVVNASNQTMVPNALTYR